jgi:hypothetical protein
MNGAEAIAAAGFFAAVIAAVTQAGSIVRARIAARAQKLPDDTAHRLERIENAVDVIAVEVERITEGQRFLTRVLADSGNREARALLSAREEQPDSSSSGDRTSDPRLR